MDDTGQVEVLTFHKVNDDGEDDVSGNLLQSAARRGSGGFLEERRPSGKRLSESYAGLSSSRVGTAIITSTAPAAPRIKPRTVRITEAESPSSQKKQTTFRIHETGSKTKIKSHSIHGMTEDDADARPHREMGVLTYEEKKFLLAVERGDVASVRRMLQSTVDSGVLNINCCDPLGRSALLMAIDNENLEMVDLLLDNKVETKDALLHAINEEFVEAVEVLLEHEETIHREGEPHSWEAIPPDTANFTPDITPLVLAAHRDNYEIIKILLDRGAILPVPHDVRCGCDECSTCRQEDSLRHSRSRINAYRALASPSLIALSSKDPILTAFELSWELRRLSVLEHEFKSEYLELRTQCQKFATALLDHTRSSTELEILLNHDPTGPVYQHGERMHLNRLKLAIKYRQKKFVAHPNVQQLLASIWYEGLPGFRQMNMFLQTLEVCRIGLLFPFFSLAYIVFPCAGFSLKLRKPFIKFICTSASYFTFLFLLILASQRIEVVIAEWFQNESLKEWLSKDVTTKRGATPTMVEWAILSWVAGLIWSEIKQLWEVGLREYVSDMWNVVDFVTNSLYVATIALRLVAYYKVQEEIRRGSPTAYLPREHWDTWDPMLISEGLFAAANIFSNLKLVYIFSVNPYLGPLQVSLSRMVMDIMKFISLFVLVLFAFSCGANQLLWYYADLEKQRCYTDQQQQVGKANYSQPMGNISFANLTGGSSTIIHDINHCLAWRRFANLWETSQTLFWAIFGLIDLDNFELTGIKEFTRFSGLLMFGSFSVINIIVLLNLLIAMMNHSYQLISVSSEKADTEWKFARSKLWISYFEEGGTVPPPFNIIPTPKSVYYCLRWTYHKLCGRSSQIKKEHLKTRKVRQASERDIRYQSVMRNLVRRYVTQEQRKAESQGVTEDDVNEIKNDISAFRFELIEILRSSGMNTASATGPSGAAGKKNRLKERRLMKGFNLSSGGLGASVCGTTVQPSPSGGPNKKASLTLPQNEITIDMIAQVKKSPMHRLARLAKIAGTARDNFVNLGLGGSNSSGEKGATYSMGDNANCDNTHLGLRWGNLVQSVGRSPGTASRGGSTEEGESLAGVPIRPTLGPRISDTSDESSMGTLAPTDMIGRSSGSKRDKYSKARSPIQCLNPTQLQPPSTIVKADALSMQADDQDVSDSDGKRFEGSRKSLQRMFRFDANDPESGSPTPFPMTELETIFGSSPSTPKSLPQFDDQHQVLATPLNGATVAAASSCPTHSTTMSSAPTVGPLVPGLTPTTARNRSAVNSGWL